MNPTDEMARRRPRGKVTPSGRSRYFEKNSIGMTRNFNGSGTPGGLMFEKKYLGPCFTKPVTMNVSQLTMARKSGIASRDVAGK